MKKIPFLISLFFLVLSATSCFSPKSTDILILSPHPDDETLCCGGTIAKAISEKKSVKVVFLTNGDAYTLDKKERDSYYIALGKERQREAQKAVEKLGLRKEDLIFLSYPDAGLSPIWEEDYDFNYRSEHTQVSFSPYPLTFARAREGYNKKNLLLDLRDILKKYKPKKIYTPHPLDNHPDHSATSKFLYLALDELRAEKEKWIDSMEIFYYLVHRPDGICVCPQFDHKEDIKDYKIKKELALKEYVSQKEVIQELGQENRMLVKGDKEGFWNVDRLSSSEYLSPELFQKEWEIVAKFMLKEGYNVNLGVVADVTKNISCFANRLLRDERIYSDDPKVVSQLVLSQVKGMNDDVIPVVKHFPGLGQSYEKDPHLWLPKIFVSKQELERMLLPYRELIKSDERFWVMVDHAVYPFLDEKPASFSYKIVSELLRKELGFEGIIIVDELNAMGGPRHYAALMGVKPPYIGDILTMTFEAGVDLGLVYCRPQEAEKVVLQILSAVEKAVEQGRLKEKDIDRSVQRILEEKEDLFGLPLVHLLPEMSLREKIAQKLIFDAWTEEEIEIYKRFGLGGVHIRKSQFADKLKQGVKIPMFIVGQQEGGWIEEGGLKRRIHNKSAYIVGREFEHLVFREKKRRPSLERKWLPSFYPAQCRVLCLAAHPDDEDAEALLYLKEKFGCQTYLLLFTRGEGGENRVNPSLYKDLGFLRTEEVEKAASILGVKRVCYLGKPDFEYTTSLKRVGKEWDERDTLRRLVYFYRLIRPHIIITKHNKSELSAQHRAVAILSEEAFDLAGNPKSFAQQLESGVSVWQPLKLFHRTYEDKYDVLLNPHQRVPLRNKTYQEITLEALSQHRSQGFGKWVLEKYKDIEENIRYSLIKSKGVSESKPRTMVVRDKDFLSLNELAEIHKEERKLIERKFLPSGVIGINIFLNRIGLLEENNNTLFIVLKTLGFDVQRIKRDVLQEGNLSDFDTIVIGQYMNDYICEDFPYGLKRIRENLLEFVEQGGNLVVFNQLSRFEDQVLWSPLSLELFFEPITDENSPIKILSTDEPLFNFPNKIEEKDFKGWIHQRGWSFPYKYSKNFIELASCQNPLKKTVKSGYLVAYLGKGRYIYTSYDWNRQLRNFHFGALKNLANMVSYNKNCKEFLSPALPVEETEIAAEYIKCKMKCAREGITSELKNCYLDETGESFQKGKGCLCLDGIDNDCDGLIDFQDNDCPILGKDVVIENDAYFAKDKDISPDGLYILSGTLKIGSNVKLTVGKRGIHVQDGAKIELEEGALIDIK